MTELSIREDSLSPEAVQARMQYAQALASSNLLPDAYKRQPANVLLAIEMGQALGIKPIAAINGISVIKGKPALSADLMATVVRNAGHKLRIEEKGMAVKATLIRKDDPDFEFTAIWDKAKATLAGLWGSKGPWSQYPQQMLRSRAITEVCRQGASECLYGAIYSPEELQSAHAQRTPQGTVQDTQETPQQACSRIVREHVAQHGGDPNELREEWLAAGGKADPEALARWLADMVSGAEIIDAEIVEEGTNDDA